MFPLFDDMLPVLGGSDRLQARYRFRFRFDVTDIGFVEFGRGVAFGVIVYGHTAGRGGGIDRVQAGHQQVLRLVDVGMCSRSASRYARRLAAVLYIK